MSSAAMHPVNDGLTEQASLKGLPVQTGAPAPGCEQSRMFNEGLSCKVAAATRNAASADWKAIWRSYWLADILFCNKVVPIAASPTSVITISRINATISAAP